MCQRKRSIALSQKKHCSFAKEALLFRKRSIALSQKKHGSFAKEAWLFRKRTNPNMEKSRQMQTQAKFLKSKDPTPI